mgnify:CR=1 FL=1
MSSKNIILLKNIMWAYAQMVVKETPLEHRHKEWYAQAVRVNTVMSKFNYKKLGKQTLQYLNTKHNQIKDLDADYFEDKLFSSYVCMLFILNYLIDECRDIEARSRFGHIRSIEHIAEIEKTDSLRQCGKDTHRYITKLIQLIGE